MTEQFHQPEPTLSEQYSRATAAYYGKTIGEDRKLPTPQYVETAEQIAHMADAELTQIKQANLNPAVVAYLLEGLVKNVESFHAKSVDAEDEFDEQAQQTDAFKYRLEDSSPREAHDPEQFTVKAIETFQTKKTFDEMTDNF